MKTRVLILTAVLAVAACSDSVVLTTPPAPPPAPPPVDFTTFVKGIFMETDETGLPRDISNVEFGFNDDGDTTAFDDLL